MAPATPPRNSAWGRTRFLLRLPDERGDWAIPAAVVMALVMLAALAGAIDGADLAYARLRIWQALASTARAAARCLIEPINTVSTTEESSAGASASFVPNTDALTCVNATVQTVFPDSLGTGSLVDAQAHASLAMASQSVHPVVTVTAQARLLLPFAMPGFAQVPIQQSATAIVLAVPRFATGSPP